MMPTRNRSASIRVTVGPTQANYRIVYNSATGALLFDADGVGGAAAIQFTTVSTRLAMSGGAFFVV